MPGLVNCTSKTGGAPQQYSEYSAHVVRGGVQRRTGLDATGTQAHLARCRGVESRTGAHTRLSRRRGGTAQPSS